MINNLYNSMTEAFTNGRTVQTAVREFLSEHGPHDPQEAAELVAETISAWRQTNNNIIEGDDHRKVINNIINDVSRICKKEISYKIICKSRKEHVYVAEKVEAKEPVIEEPTSEPTPTEIPFEPELPLEVVLAQLMDKHGDEAVGSAVAALLKARS